MKNGEWELKPEQLRRKYKSTDFGFDTTAAVAPLEGIIGQERAARALEFGLKIRRHGYNIFVSGATGTGRNSYAVSLVQKLASQEETPSDWCYIYNFHQPDQPLALELPAGNAVTFSEEIKTLISRVIEEIPQAFASDDFGKDKTKLLQELQELQTESLDILHRKGKELGFILKNSEKGLVSIPLNVEGKPMDEQEYENLDREEAKLIDEKSRELNLLIIDTIKKITEMERKTQERIESLEIQVASATLEKIFRQIVEKYSEFPLIQEYLENIRKDILSNLGDFKSKEEKFSIDRLLLLRGDKSRDHTFKYRVNVLVDNSKTEGAPVISETNPTYYNLIGKSEYETSLGVLTTDYTKIKAGALHRANGGYLLLQCGELLRNIYSWQGLKRALKNKKLFIENLNEQLGIIATSSLKPQPIPLNVKVILIGSTLEYQLLYHYDEDFRKLFKIKADFDVEMERNDHHVYQLAQFISDHCARENLLRFDGGAVAGVVEYSSRLAEDQEKLSARFNEIEEIIYEANAWAELENAPLVSREHVRKAVREKMYRSNKFEVKLREMIERGKILIDVEGWVVGQVNGLAVLDMGDYAFGKPARITVNTFTGRRGIINIEREAKMSGSIHDKGVLILSGYLGEKFGSKCPLSFSASICFEQQYNGIEGDSASSAELFGLLSSLAGIPLKQGIAVTGSINQKGQIQPIGGVNQKIEGFFKICSAKGLTGEQGVIIPRQNISNLMLDEEIVQAVSEGKFHVYAVDTVEEGIEILSDLPAGKADREGNYPPGTVFRMVQDRIVELYKLAMKEEEEEETKEAK